MPCSRDLPDPGIEPVSLVSPALAGGLFTTSATRGMHSLKGNPSLHESRCSKVRRGLLLVLFALGRQFYSGTDRHHFQTLESGFIYQNPDWRLRPCRALRHCTCQAGGWVPFNCPRLPVSDSRAACVHT